MASPGSSSFAATVQAVPQGGPALLRHLPGHADPLRVQRGKPRGCRARCAAGRGEALSGVQGLCSAQHQLERSGAHVAPGILGLGVLGGGFSGALILSSWHDLTAYSDYLTISYNLYVCTHTRAYIYTHTEVLLARFAWFGSAVWTFHTTQREGWGVVCARQKWVVCARQTVGRLCTFLLCDFVIVAL